MKIFSMRVKKKSKRQFVATVVCETVEAKKIFKS